MHLGIMRFFTPDLGRLRLLGFVGPVAFAVAVGIFTNLVLERIVPGLTAHVIASSIVVVGALVFTLWMFGMLAVLNRHAEEAARAEERRRIALTLHDEVIQSLYAVQLGLEACLRDGAKSSNDGRRNDAHQRIDQAVQELDQVVASVRHHIIEEDLN